MRRPHPGPASGAGPRKLSTVSDSDVNQERGILRHSVGCRQGAAQGRHVLYIPRSSSGCTAALRHGGCPAALVTLQWRCAVRCVKASLPWREGTRAARAGPAPSERGSGAAASAKRMPGRQPRDECRRDRDRGWGTRLRRGCRLAGDGCGRQAGRGAARITGAGGPPRFFAGGARIWARCDGAAGAAAVALRVAAERGGGSERASELDGMAWLTLCESQSAA